MERKRDEVKVVLFDLDNVLYNSPKLAQETEKLITAFFRDELGFSDEGEIEAQKRRYFDQHGLVLKGLMNDRPDLNVDLYLDKVDGSLPLDECLKRDDELRTMLQAMRPEIKKVILTNAAKGHVQRTTHILGIDDCFDDIIDIFALDFNPKPEKQSFEIALAKCRKLVGDDDLTPRECMLVDDNLNTIKEAEKMGFRTLWIHDLNSDQEGEDGRKEAVGPGIITASRIHALPNVYPELFCRP